MSQKFSTVYCIDYFLQAIFLHSVDEKFQPLGQKSQIPYLKLFSTYKETIITKLNKEDKYFEDLILWYNSEVFNWFDANNGRNGSGSDSSGIDDVLNIGNLTIDDIQIREQDDGGAWDCERIQFGAPEVCFHHTNEITFITSINRVKILL